MLILFYIYLFSHLSLLLLFSMLMTLSARLPSPHQNYKVHQIWIDERVDELSNSYAIESNSPCHHHHHHEHNHAHSSFQIVEGASLMRSVDMTGELKEFDGAVEIVDSVMVDHVSEDDKSTSSEEVTYERWTEETRLRRTRVFDEHGRIIDEYLQQVRPAELVGDIVRERLIERHEHVKRVSKNVLRRVKVKSLSSLDEDNSNEDENNDDIIIVEPKDTRRHQDDSTYFIQHQQVIKPPPAANSGDSFDHARCQQNCVRILAAPLSASSYSPLSPNSPPPPLNNSLNLFSVAATASNTTNNINNNDCLKPNEKSKFSLDLINAVLNMSIKENHSSPPNLSSLLRKFQIIIIAYFILVFFFI